MQLVTKPIAPASRPSQIVPLKVDRRTLAKRRWRGVADDGTEFGFDLEKPLSNSTTFFEASGAVYQIEQLREPVFRIPVLSAAQAARVAWMIGNLHFSIAITSDYLVAENDSALQQMFTREKILFEQAEMVFTPSHVAAGHSHGHSHSHDHHDHPNAGPHHHHPAHR
jgi:urease accessory protein